MLELHQSPASAAHPPQPPHPPHGFDLDALRNAWSAWTDDDHWAIHLLDQLDYGVLVVRRELTVVHANRSARRRLGGAEPLANLRDCPRLPREDLGTRRLVRAVEAAVGQGLRSTVVLRLGTSTAAVAVVPLRPQGAHGTALAMLLIQREQLCTPLALDGFGRLHGMTAAELAVLAQLCAGHEPAAIAKQQGVALSTVRTHVVAVRNKLGARSMREMLINVARLPPIAEVVPR